jgi:hypothetical protein
MKLNAGCGGSFLDGWINCDIYPWNENVQRVDMDEGLPYPDSFFDEVRLYGVLMELKNDLVFHMGQFWRVLQNGGILDIRVAVVDNGIGAFRDPIAHRYLNSQWVEYFYVGGKWENSGYGYGFKGKFEMVSNMVEGEVQHVTLKAIK